MLLMANRIRISPLPAKRPTNAQLPSESRHAPMDMDDIPQDVFDQIARDNAGGGAASGGAGIRICPHCTFENTHGGTDCEMCSLPL